MNAELCKKMSVKRVLVKFVYNVNAFALNFFSKGLGTVVFLEGYSASLSASFVSSL